MSIIPALLFCSLLLVVGSVVLFIFSARQGDCHESERLCLLPLEDDVVSTAGTAQPSSSGGNRSSSGEHEFAREAADQPKPSLFSSQS
jgi:hypothetical protein